MSLIAFAQIQMELGRRIGRKDYDGAISILESSLSNTAKDVHALEMIAHCHRWSNRIDMAIDTARRVLVHDPKKFGALRLLSEVYAERNEHDIAAPFVRLGLESYPEPTPPAPRVVFWALRLAASVVPRIKRVEEDAREHLADPNKEVRDWFSWAKQYLAWYDSISGDKQTPIVH
ncbi:MAG: hypothetical protein Q7T13_13425 [Polaromonas sp.]|nr:hypothetical protein [Polaromonas sp.]